MIALEILAWWYRPGWSQVAKNASLRFSKVSHLFSVPILLRTWFDPWRRIITHPGAGIDAQMRAMMDNFVSRMVGFTVRSIVLLTVVVMFAGCCLLAVLQIVLWPLVPLAVLISIVLGIFG